MSWFKNIKTVVKAKVSSQPPAPVERLGLRLGGSITVNPLHFKAAGPAWLARVPEGPQMIEAIGTIASTEGVVIKRYYLTDEDFFLQVLTQNGSVLERKLFTYQPLIDVSDRRHFRALVEHGGRIGQPTLNVDGRIYDRQWADDLPGEWAPPVLLEENVVKAGERYSLSLYTMLYQREIPETQTFEVALITAEDSGPNEFGATIAIGVDVEEVDLDVV